MPEEPSFWVQRWPKGEGMEVPIACSLTPRELNQRAQAWKATLRNSLISSERVSGGLRLTVSPDAMASLHELVEMERQCCPWINFSLGAESLTMTASGAGEQILLELFS